MESPNKDPVAIFMQSPLVQWVSVVAGCSLSFCIYGHIFLLDYIPYQVY